MLSLDDDHTEQNQDDDDDEHDDKRIHGYPSRVGLLTGLGIGCGGPSEIRTQDRRIKRPPIKPSCTVSTREGPEQGPALERKARLRGPSLSPAGRHQF